MKQKNKKNILKRMILKMFRYPFLAGTIWGMFIYMFCGYNWFSFILVSSILIIFCIFDEAIFNYLDKIGGRTWR